MLKFADIVLGGPMLSDVADFVLDLRTMYDGLSVRSRTIDRYLRAADTIIATTADPTPINETRRFFDELGDIRITPRAVLFNRTLPTDWIEASGGPHESIGDPRLMAAATENLAAWASEAQRQVDAANELSARYGVPVYELPWTVPAPSSLDDLADLVAPASISDWLID
jgi:hypothetical protein